MSAKPFRLMPYGFLACCFAISSTFLGTNFLGNNLHENRALPSSGLTAHEWGTFTSIAGNDGQAAEWLPLSGSTDLPGFVKDFRGRAAGEVSFLSRRVCFSRAHFGDADVRGQSARGEPRQGRDSERHPVRATRREAGLPLRKRARSANNARRRLGTKRSDPGC